MIERIFVMGGLRLQNELMVNHIKSAIGIRSAAHRQGTDSLFASLSGETTLILWDFANSDNAELWPMLPGKLDSARRKTPVAVFNVDPGHDHLTDLVMHGVRGIFYKTDPVGALVKGIAAIRKGELWVARKQLEACLCSANSVVMDAGRSNSGLTRREVEVLSGIAAGATNEEIAENLCISISTVKTHNYKIFKKIGANNRMQASLWALSHLSRSPNAQQSPASAARGVRPARTTGLS
jgi:LuxR family transcriptional regulator of csgAB operon